MCSFASGLRRARWAGCATCGCRSHCRATPPCLSIDASSPTDNNRSVMWRPWRSLLVFALAPCFVFSSVIAPPEHVHEGDAHHPHAFGHRHFEAHHHDDGDDDDDHDFDHGHGDHHDYDGVEIEHGEGRVIWLDDAGVQPGTYAFPVLDVILTTCFEAITKSTRWAAASSYNAAPPHGPPRPSTS